MWCSGQKKVSLHALWVPACYRYQHPLGASKDILTPCGAALIKYLSALHTLKVGFWLRAFVQHL